MKTSANIPSHLHF